MKHYDQDHCKRMQLMKMLKMQNKCQILPLYGTLDLVTNDTMPVCRREAMWSMMPMMRMRSEDPVMDAMMQEAEARCPRDCWQEEIQLQTSFTIMSDENFEKAWALWAHLPRNRTKLDAVFMELFFESMIAEVIYNIRLVFHVRCACVSVSSVSCR